MSESESKKAKLASDKRRMSFAGGACEITETGCPDGSNTFLTIGSFRMKEEETQHEISAMH